MYQCPSCGGRLRFDIASQKLQCDNCGNSFSPVERQPLAAQSREFETNIFTCTQCGGEIYTLDNDITGRCSYCGADMVFESRISRMMRPRQIIPFKITKDYCRDAYTRMVKRAFYAPSYLRKDTTIDQFRGIYMPYWNYRITQNSQLENLEATKSYTKGNYDITEHYRLDGTLEADYPDLIHDASSSFSDDISEKIEPYDVSGGSVPFSSAYLCGFYGEQSDVDALNYVNYALDIANSQTDSLLDKAWGEDIHVIHPDPSAYQSQCSDHYLQLLPVWFLAWQKDHRVVYATVNGQTGRAAAEFPVDPGRYFGITLLSAIPLFLLLNLFLTMRPAVAAAVTSVLAVLVLAYFRDDLKNLIRRNVELMEKQNRIVYTLKEQKLMSAKRTEKKSSPMAIFLTSVLIAVVTVGFVALVEPDLMEFLQSNALMVILSLIMLGVGFVLFLNAQDYFMLARRAEISVFPGHWVSLLTLVLVCVVEFLSPVSDLVYYGICAVAMGTVILTLVTLILTHNQITTRPLPQFQHKGGNDNGKTA